MSYHQCSMDKAKAMKQFRVSLVKDTSDSAEHALVSAQVLPALSPRYCKADPVCFGREPSYCSEEGRIIDWDLYLDYDWDLYLDYQRYYGRLNHTMKKGTEVSQGESQREQSLTQRPWKGAVHWVASPGLLSLLSYRTLEYQSRDGTTQNGLDPSLLITN